MISKKLHLSQIIESLESSKPFATPEKKIISTLTQALLRYRLRFDEMIERLNTLEKKASDLKLRISMLELQK